MFWTTAHHILYNLAGDESHGLEQECGYFVLLLPGKIAGYASVPARRLALSVERFVVAGGPLTSACDADAAWG